MYDHTFFSELAYNQIRLHITLAVSLVSAYGHLNLPHSILMVSCP